MRSLSDGGDAVAVETSLKPPNLHDPKEDLIAHFRISQSARISRRGRPPPILERLSISSSLIWGSIAEGGARKVGVNRPRALPDSSINSTVCPNRRYAELDGDTDADRGKCISRRGWVEDRHAGNPRILSKMRRSHYPRTALGIGVVPFLRVIMFTRVNLRFQHSHCGEVNNPSTRFHP